LKRPDYSLMDRTAALLLDELSHSHARALEVAVSAAEEEVRRYVAATLGAAGIDVAVTARDSAELLEELRAYTVDAAVCVALGRDEEIAAVRTLRARPPHTQLVLIGRTTSRPRLRRMLDLGAQGFVLEAQVATALAPAVRAACSGLVCVPTDLSQNVERGALTTRQREVLHLVALGRGNAEIARALYVSESTVKAHLSAAFAKLGVRSRSEASALILDPDTCQGLGIQGLAHAAHR
jgi:DNA-binding NarL/FixJ family response regulator